VAKRMTNAEATAFGILIVFVAIIAAVAKIFEAIGYVIPLVLFLLVIVALAWNNTLQRRKRLEYLRGKYNDETIVQRILQHTYWEGQTSEQLIDSLGSPVAVDRKLLKTRTGEIWKYNPHGTNRYGLRITLDAGNVVGWDQKSW